MDSIDLEQEHFIRIYFNLMTDNYDGVYWNLFNLFIWMIIYWKKILSNLNYKHHRNIYNLNNLFILIDWKNRIALNAWSKSQYKQIKYIIPNQAFKVFENINKNK